MKNEIKIKDKLFKLVFSLKRYFELNNLNNLPLPLKEEIGSIAEKIMHSFFFEIIFSINLFVFYPKLFVIFNVKKQELIKSFVLQTKKTNIDNNDNNDINDINNDDDNNDDKDEETSGKNKEKIKWN